MYRCKSRSTDWWTSSQVQRKSDLSIRGVNSHLQILSFIVFNCSTCLSGSWYWESLACCTILCEWQYRNISPVSNTCRPWTEHTDWASRRWSMCIVSLCEAPWKKKLWVYRDSKYLLLMLSSMRIMLVWKLWTPISCLIYLHQQKVERYLVQFSICLILFYFIFFSVLSIMSRFLLLCRMTLGKIDVLAFEKIYW